MPKDRIADFFSEYKKAFVKEDLQKVSEFFHYPCIIARAGSPVTSLKTPDELQQFEQSSLDYFKSIQMEKANVEVSFYRTYDAGNIISDVSFDLFGPQGAFLGKVHWLYHLLDSNDELKILTAHYVVQ